MVDACIEGNRLRILKLHSLETVRGPKNALAILRLLEKTRCVANALPLSQFYNKIQLNGDAKENDFISSLRTANVKIKATKQAPLFQSIYNGDITVDLLPPEVVKERGRMGYFIFEEPPPRITFSEVRNWIAENAKLRIVDDQGIGWGVAPQALLALLYVCFALLPTIMLLSLRLCIMGRFSECYFRGTLANHDLSHAFTAAFKPQQELGALPRVVEAVFNEVFGDPAFDEACVGGIYPPPDPMASEHVEPNLQADGGGSAATIMRKLFHPLSNIFKTPVPVSPVFSANNFATLPSTIPLSCPKAITPVAPSLFPIFARESKRGEEKKSIGGVCPVENFDEGRHVNTTGLADFLQAC